MAKFLLPLLLMMMLCAPLHGAGTQLQSVAPAEDVPGAEIVLRGGPFDGTVRVVLGELRIRPSRIYSRHLFFKVPPIKPGQYSLSLIQAGSPAPGDFSFRVIPPRPAIVALRPWKFYACAYPLELHLELELSQSPPGTSILLNGSAIPYESQQQNRVSIELPLLPEGLHEIKLVTPQRQESLPSSLYFDATPQIFTIEQEDDRVNAYSLIISGRNFFATSKLSINNRIVGASEPAGSASDHLEYIDCNSLRYIRYPTGASPETTELRIINPDGRQSPPYSLNLR